jgi:hypothetical protein
MTPAERMPMHTTWVAGVTRLHAARRPERKEPS